jgi:hypothetical protein
MDGWYNLAEKSWSILAENWWCILAEKPWYILAENEWYIYVRKLTKPASSLSYTGSSIVQAPELVGHPTPENAGLDDDRFDSV